MWQIWSKTETKNTTIKNWDELICRTTQSSTINACCSVSAHHINGIILAGPMDKNVTIEDRDWFIFCIKLCHFAAARTLKSCGSRLKKHANILTFRIAQLCSSTFLYLLYMGLLDYVVTMLNHGFIGILGQDDLPCLLLDGDTLKWVQSAAKISGHSANI